MDQIELIVPDYLMSDFGGKADVIQGVAGCPLIANNGHLNDLGVVN